MPPGTPPYTFINAVNSAYAAEVSDLTVTRLNDCGACASARIKCKITIPLDVYYCDSTGAKLTAAAEMTVPEDLVMHVPNASAVPFEVIAFANETCEGGEFITDTLVDAQACANIITKVVHDTDIIVPTCGIACPHPATEYCACEEFFRRS
jgi:hypothetical protein